MPKWNHLGINLKKLIFFSVENTFLVTLVGVVIKLNYCHDSVLFPWYPAILETLSKLSSWAFHPIISIALFNLYRTSVTILARVKGRIRIERELRISVAILHVSENYRYFEQPVVVYCLFQQYEKLCNYVPRIIDINI